MPFRYTPNQNRYVGSIADLMGRGNDAEAQALITSANAQAQAAQASGQAWGGAVQGIGNTIAAIPGQMQAAEDRDRVMEQRERADRTRAMDAEIFNPASMTGPTMADGTPTTPGVPEEGPGSMAGDVAYGRELNNPYKTKNANGSSVFDRGKIIETYVAAGLDPPNLAAFDAFNESVTRNYDEYLQQSRIMAADLLKEPPETWSTGALTILDVLEDNGIFTPENVNAARRQLKAAEGLEGQAKIDAVGQLIYRYSGQETPETKFVNEDAVAVTVDPVTGKNVYDRVTPLSQRPQGKPDVVSIDGRSGWAWWDANGIPRTRSGEEITGDVQPASAIEQQAAAGSLGDLVQQALLIKETELGRPLEPQEHYDVAQAIADRNRATDTPPGQLSFPQMEAAMELSERLRGDPFYKGMTEINGGWQSLKASYGFQHTGLSDIAMINSFQRMIDPGATVREGDVALIQAALSLFNRLNAETIINGLKTGNVLPAPDRNQMMELGRAIYDARLEDYQGRTGDRFESLAAQVGVPFEMVSSGFAPSSYGRWDDE